MAPPQFHSPLCDPSAIWLKSVTEAGDMLFASAEVVGHRTFRMATAGPMASERDRNEFSLMSREKEEAAFESLQAFGLACLKLTMAMTTETPPHLWETSAATTALLASRSPSQWLDRHAAWARIAANAPTGPLRLAHAATQVIQESLAPIHDRATANAARLRAL